MFLQKEFELLVFDTNVVAKLSLSLLEAPKQIE